MFEARKLPNHNWNVLSDVSCSALLGGVRSAGLYEWRQGLTGEGQSFESWMRRVVRR